MYGAHCPSVLVECLPHGRSGSMHTLNRLLLVAHVVFFKELYSTIVESLDFVTKWNMEPIGQQTVYLKLARGTPSVP
jgi:hypothetical protein